MNTLLWVVLPYAALTVFVLGHAWRWRTDQFGWSTHTSQVLESRLLRLASPLFHLGMLMVVGGHALGLLVPVSWTEAVGITEGAYHALSLYAGGLAGVMLTAGLALLLARRLVNGRVRRVTSRVDVVLYAWMTVIILLGMSTKVGSLLGHGHEYRGDVAVWFRGILALDPSAELMASAPLVYQLHALAALGLFALWPFTRLVHVFSIPLAYAWRPYVVYRKRPEGVAVVPPAIPRPRVRPEKTVRPALTVGHR